MNIKSDRRWEETFSLSTVKEERRQKGGRREGEEKLEEGKGRNKKEKWKWNGKEIRKE